MTVFQRLFGAALLAAVAFWAARALGVPVWRNWIPGDASDWAVSVFVAIMVLTYRRLQTKS